MESKAPRDARGAANTRVPQLVLRQPVSDGLCSSPAIKEEPILVHVDGVLAAQMHRHDYVYEVLAANRPKYAGG